MLCQSLLYGKVNQPCIYIYLLPFGLSPSINFAVLELLRIMHYDFFSILLFEYGGFSCVCVCSISSHSLFFFLNQHRVSLQCCFSFNNSVSKIIQLYVDTDIEYSSMCYTVGPWFAGLVPRWCWKLATLQTVACQAPLSVGFSRQEYWSGLPFPSPGESSPQQVLVVCLFYRQQCVSGGFPGCTSGKESACLSRRHKRCGVSP